MRVIRVFFLILVVFATTAIYIQAQYIYHSENWWNAVKELLMNAWGVSLAAIIIVGVYIWLELRTQKKEGDERCRNNAIWEAIAKKLGVDLNELDCKKPKRKREDTIFDG